MTYPPDLQALQDRAEIHDLVMRYFHGCDTGDKALVRACFTDDVIARYEGREPVRGADALVGQIALFKNLDSGACTIATHFTGNLRYERLEHDDAEVHINAVAFLIGPEGVAATAGAAGVVATRGLRYLAKLRRVEGRWKIAVYLHTLDWSSDVPCSFARAFAERVGDTTSFERGFARDPGIA